VIVSNVIFGLTVKFYFISYWRKNICVSIYRYFNFNIIL